jgi:hypothetical protein
LCKERHIAKTDTFAEIQVHSGTPARLITTAIETVAQFSAFA